MLTAECKIAGTRSFTYMSHTSINRINILAGSDRRTRNIPPKNNSNNQSVNSNNTRHYNGDDIFHYRAWMADTCV